MFSGIPIWPTEMPGGPADTRSLSLLNRQGLHRGAGLRVEYSIQIPEAFFLLLFLNHQLAAFSEQQFLEP